MDVVIIPQKNSLINGIPAHKVGEWDFNKPSHWYSSKRILQPIERREKRNIGLIEGNIKNYFTETKLNCIKKSQEHIEFNHRNYSQFKISEDDTKIKRGRKYIMIKYNEPKIYNKNILSDNIYIKDEKIRCMKQFPEDIKKCKNEVFIEKQMGGKKMINSLEIMRNDFNLISPGDKIYKNVDYSPDFFQEGGLAVGSSNRINYNKTKGKRSDNFFESLDLNVSVLNKEKLWKNKVFKESLNFDKGYVNHLDKWEENYLNPTLPPVNDDKKLFNNSSIQNKNFNNKKK